jgi:hypothetical protein
MVAQIVATASEDRTCAKKVVQTMASDPAALGKIAGAEGLAYAELQSAHNLLQDKRHVDPSGRRNCGARHRARERPQKVTKSSDEAVYKM